MAPQIWVQRHGDKTTLTLSTASATHFAGQGNIYELWNKPYIQTDGSQIVDNYMAFVKQVSPAIRQADPSAPVVALSMNLNATPTAGGTATSWMTSCFATRFA